MTNSCVEQIDVKTLTFEDALVVEGTITNEYKFQEIKLSRTYKLEEEGPTVEHGAVISVIDDMGNTYSFQEGTLGVYISDVEFKAIPDREYQLNISTSKGNTYSSNPTKLTPDATIDEVYALESEDDDGVSIFINSFNPNRNSRYYRYDYEETYKIIAPNWSEYDFEIVSDQPPFKVKKVLKTKEDRTCYKTDYSDGIIQTSSDNLNEDRVSKFLVRKVSRNDFFLCHRYSILVKQYVQSLEAYTFYNILEKLSGSESLFSQNQPGFISGNMFSNEDSTKKIIGYFEVSSVSSKRLFFNVRDIIAGGSIHDSNCELRAPLLNDGFGNSPLIESIKVHLSKYYVDNDGLTLSEVIEPGGPYVVVFPKCGDCTVLGSNIVPEFWQE